MIEAEADASLAAPMSDVLIFDEGVPGFPDARNFALTDLVETGEFQIFHDMDDPDVAMVVAVPWLFFPDYAPELSDLEQAGLELTAAEDALVFCSISFEGATPFMNLLGPFIVNAHTRKGRQIVLTNQEYPLRAEIPVG